MSKKLEDLTLEEIKAQMSIFQTLYQRKRREIDPEYAEKIRQKDRDRYYKRKEAEGKLPKKEGNRKYHNEGLMLVPIAST